MWHDDSIFLADGVLHGRGSPTFRLTAYLPYYPAHPYRLTEEWQKLFDCYAAIIARRCDRVAMYDRPGAPARRGYKIRPEDWKPFHYLKSVYSDVEGGMFTGFYFIDSTDRDRSDGRGPCSFRFFVGSTIRLDACIPLQDWEDGALDIDAVVTILQQLPYISFLCGFGLSLSESYAFGDTQTILRGLMDYGFRYPAVDIARDEDRSWFPGAMENYPLVGIAGINWITGIGDPFFSRAGGPRLAEALPPGMGARVGPYGAAFRLGSRPTSGEPGVDDEFLGLYHHLGSRLATAWVPTEKSPRAPVFGRSFQAESLAWERRFYSPARG